MPVPTSVKKALLVGIQYSANENLKEHGFPEQPGAHKDTDSLHKLLTSALATIVGRGFTMADQFYAAKYGYKEEDIVILIDSDSCSKQPTRDNIVSGTMKRILTDHSRLIVSITA